MPERELDPTGLYRAVVPFATVDPGISFHPDVTVRGDAPGVREHADKFVPAGMDEQSFRRLQAELIADEQVAGKKSGADQLAEMARHQRETREAEQETAERLRREAREFAMHRLVADSRKSPMEASAVHPDVARAWLIAKALDDRFQRKGDEGIPGELVAGEET